MGVGDTIADTWDGFLDVLGTFWGMLILLTFVVLIIALIVALVSINGSKGDSDRVIVINADRAGGSTSSYGRSKESRRSSKNTENHGKDRKHHHKGHSESCSCSNPSVEV